ncbi:hypothetical protein [Chromatium okenii]|nr:hypothetical protein [Chromatium okenii]
MHRMLLTGRAQRVLIVTPEPLLHQWLVEMRGGSICGLRCSTTSAWT